jgi:hypothetical protein
VDNTALHDDGIVLYITATSLNEDHHHHCKLLPAGFPFLRLPLAVMKDRMRQTSRMVALDEELPPRTPLHHDPPNWEYSQQYAGGIPSSYSMAPAHLNAPSAYRKDHAEREEARVKAQEEEARGKYEEEQ